MQKQIHNAQRESAPMLEEALALTSQKQAVETKQKLLRAFNEHYIVSEEDLNMLTSLTEPVDNRFYQIMNHVKQIRKDCEVLLGMEDQSLGIELMEQTSRNLDAAFKKLYTWIQRKFRILDLEDPQISGSIRRALRVLAERPSLFQNCLDFFAEAREHTLSDTFHEALTESVARGSILARSSNPIEMQTHDMLRYIGDMLAWVHSTTVSEREALESLFVSDGDEIAKEIQAGRNSEPWSRAHQGENETDDSTPAYDGRKTMNELLNRNLEGISRVLKQRVEVAIHSNDDPLSVYRALDLFRFYQDIFVKLVGAPSILGDTFAELQTSAFSHFERLLQDEISTVATETISEGLSTPPFLIRALDQFKSFINTGADVSGLQVSQLLSAALVPFLERCSEIANGMSDSNSQNIFQLNYLSAVDTALRTMLTPNHSFLQAVRRNVDELREELIGTQHLFLLRQSGMGQLLDAVRKAKADTSAPLAITSSPVFNAEALSNSAAQLDEFLPSAFMDLLENMKELTDKSLSKQIAQVATERFCADFEVVEEAMLTDDAERQGRIRRRDVEEEDEREVLLRHLYPRTTAEIRVLLS